MPSPRAHVSRVCYAGMACSPARQVCLSACFGMSDQLKRLPRLAGLIALKRYCYFDCRCCLALAVAAKRRCLTGRGTMSGASCLCRLRLPCGETFVCALLALAPACSSIDTPLSSISIFRLLPPYHRPLFFNLLSLLADTQSQRPTLFFITALPSASSFPSAATRSHRCRGWRASPVVVHLHLLRP